MKAFTKKIVLENGREFYGYGFGADREAINEIVFNTSMVGYQEIMSDPSYTDQMVVMTYPLIGNYGMADEDYETKTPTIGGMIVREYNDSPSQLPLHEDVERGLRGARHSGHLGRRYPCPDAHHPRRGDPEGDRHRRRDAPRRGPAQIAGVRHAARHGCARELQEALVCRASPTTNTTWWPLTAASSYNIIRLLNRVGCNVTVVPYNSTVEEIMAFQPDGLVLSNGPGDPEDVAPVIELVKAAPGQAADLRHLPGTSDDFAGLRRQDLQDEVRPPRRQPSGEEPA